MQNLLSLIAVLSLFGITAVASLANHSVDDKHVEDRLIGAWRLVWLEQPDRSGNVHKADCSGLLVYSRDGHMSVQVMYASPQQGSQAGPVEYAQGGYEASFGTYRINDAHTFTFHVQGAMMRSLVGKDLLRSFELSGTQMIVKSTNTNEHWRVAWEHY